MGTEFQRVQLPVRFDKRQLQEEVRAPLVLRTNGVPRVYSARQGLLYKLPHGLTCKTLPTVDENYT